MLKATVKSISNEYETYVIENILAITYTKGAIFFTYLINNEPYTTSYSSDNVIIAIA